MKLSLISTTITAFALAPLIPAAPVPSLDALNREEPLLLTRTPMDTFQLFGTPIKFLKPAEDVVGIEDMTRLTLGSTSRAPAEPRLQTDALQPVPLSAHEAAGGQQQLTGSVREHRQKRPSQAHEHVDLDVLSAFSTNRPQPRPDAAAHHSQLSLGVPTDRSERSLKRHFAAGEGQPTSNELEAARRVRSGSTSSHVSETGSSASVQPLPVSEQRRKYATVTLDQLTSPDAKLLQKIVARSHRPKDELILDAEIYILQRLEEPSFRAPFEGKRRGLTKQPPGGSKFGIPNPGYPPEIWQKANANVYNRAHNQRVSEENQQLMERVRARQDAQLG